MCVVLKGKLWQSRLYAILIGHCSLNIFNSSKVSFKKLNTLNLHILINFSLFQITVIFLSTTFIALFFFSNVHDSFDWSPKYQTEGYSPTPQEGYNLWSCAVKT